MSLGSGFQIVVLRTDYGGNNEDLPPSLFQSTSAFILFYLFNLKDLNACCRVCNIIKFKLYNMKTLC